MARAHDPDPLVRERAAVTVVFLLNGGLFSRLPAIKADLGLGDRELGLILLLAAVGLLAELLELRAALLLPALLCCGALALTGALAARAHAGRPAS